MKEIKLQIQGKARQFVQMLMMGVAVIGLSACGKDGSANASQENTTPEASASDPSDHFYDLKEGDEYSYSSAPSENDMASGDQVGNVSTFKYLGESGGVYTLAGLGNDGRIEFRLRCTNPCSIVKADNGEKLPFNPETVIGVAFRDAFGGKLEVAK